MRGRAEAGNVARYHDGIVKEVGMIAHSCGVHDPRQLARRHCRMMINGQTVPLEELYPDVAEPAD